MTIIARVLIVALVITASACSGASPTAPTPAPPQAAAPPPVVVPPPVAQPAPPAPPLTPSGLRATVRVPANGSTLVYARPGDQLEDRQIEVSYNPPLASTQGVEEGVEIAVCYGSKPGQWIVGSCNRYTSSFVARPTLWAHDPYHVTVTQTKWLVVMRTKGMNWEGLKREDPYQMNVATHPAVLEHLILDFEVNWKH